MMKNYLLNLFCCLLLASCGNDPIVRGAVCAGISNSFQEFSELVVYSTTSGDIEDEYGSPDEYSSSRAGIDLIEIFIYYSLAGAVIKGCQSYKFSFRNGVLVSKEII